MGWASGMRAGIDIGRAYNEGVERNRVREAMGLTPQAMEQRQATPEELSRAQAETQGLAARDAAEFGLTPQDQAMYAPQMPVEGQRIGATQYGLGGQTFNRMPTQQEIESARYGAAANVIAERDPVAAMRMRREMEEQAYQAQRRPLEMQQLEGSIAGQAQQRELAGIQIGGAKRTEARDVGFDGAITQINKTEYATPAEKNAAILAAVSQFKGPEAAIALEKNYNDIERGRILTEGAKFDQTIKQARLKGPAAALKAIDELNDSFTLEVDGFKVTQVNKDGTRVPFLQGKNADEFALLVDSRIKDGGAFELAKFRQDELTKNAQIAYYNSLAKKAAREGSAAANQLSGVQVGYSRDPKTGQPIQVMTALRFNKQSGNLESVQVPLDQNVVPASALDPKKIAEQADSLVNTPVDPTNKKGPQHTFLTAQQAVVDQIFNQYLGTGVPAGGLDLSPAAVAKRMLDAQKPAATSTPAASAPVGLSFGQQLPSAVPTAREARFEQNAQAATAMREREQRAAGDPDIRALRVQLANLRSGDPRKTAELTQQILDLRQQRYGF